MRYTFDFSVLFQDQYFDLFVTGIRTTFMLTASTLMLAFGFAVVLLGIRLTGFKPLEALVAIYVAFHRNVPMVVHILFWYFGVSAILPSPISRWLYANHAEFTMAFVAIGLVGAAYISEDLRSAVRSIPAGQTEAARALGLSYVRTLRRVILPQAFRISIPPLTNQTVLLFKNTSLAMAIGVLEATGAAREIENYTFRTFEVYIVITIFYLLVSLGIMWLGGVLATRFETIGRSSGPRKASIAND